MKANIDLILLTGCLLLSGMPRQANAQSANQNYVLTRTFTSEDGSKYLDAIQYYDGLGRPAQQVQRKITPLGADLVTLQEYDAAGRESCLWLPGTSSANGAYVAPETLKTSAKTLNGDQNPYSIPVYEASPLNRVLERYGPGAAWHNTSRSAKITYLTNVSGNDTLNCLYYKVASTAITTDSVVTLTLAGNYTTADLYVTRISDEDGNTSLEFKNKQGQVVLIRQLVRSGSTKILHDTYYVYDDYDNLTAVLPPLASDNLKSGNSWSNENSAVLRNYAYLYLYDGRNRCKGKRIPGCAWLYYVYDTADRLIFSQNGKQRVSGEWTFSIPDVFGRPCLMGTCNGSYNALAISPPLNNIVMQATRNNTTGIYKGYAVSGITLTNPIVLNVNYYDDYTFIGTNGVDLSIAAYEAISGFNTRYNNSSKAFLTGTLSAQLLPDGTVSSNYLYWVMYYDYRGRVIQVKGNNTLSEGSEKEYIAYNFTGQPLQKKHIHAATGKATQTELYTYTYDDALRLKTTQYSLNGGAAVTLTSNSYDELGRLKANERNGHSNLKTNYNYTVRSWTKSITSPLFRQTLYYQDANINHTNTPCYNGNISSMEWVATDRTERGYDFAYDQLSRLTASDYLESRARSNKFSTSYRYDKQGNVLSLNRRGNSGTTTYGVIDELSLTYRGNQLLKVDDAATNPTLSMSLDFKDGARQEIEYDYDANGNQVKDLNKGISKIEYNVLNLPKKVTFTGVNNPTTTYVYSAGGDKLSVIHKSSIEKRTDYVGAMIYENGSLKRILVDGGYIENGIYHFFLQDHQGNNRIVAKADGAVIQSNHYYPYGMPFAESTYTDKQPYKYNGKELDAEYGLNLYDYGARQMESLFGRFTTIDPLLEKYYSWSPYAYCANNPVKFIDPDGMDYWSTNNPNEIKRFLGTVGWNTNPRAFESFDFKSWNHGTDAEFTGDLTYNDETKTYYSSYGTVENGEFVKVGVSIKASSEYDGYANIPNQSAIDWRERASGRISQLNLEFGVLAGISNPARALIKTIWSALNTPVVSSNNTFNAFAGKSFKGGKQNVRDASIKQYPKNFQRWYHKYYKGNRGFDASKEELKEIYNEWINLGSPQIK